MATLDRGSIRGRDKPEPQACIGRKGGNVLFVRMTRKSCSIFNEAATRGLGSAHV